MSSDQQVQRDAKIVQMARDGQTTREIADTVALTMGRVATILRRAGVRARLPQAAPERNAEMARRYAAGETTIQLAEAYGITTQRVSQILADQGVDVDGFRFSGMYECSGCTARYRRRSYVGDDGVRVRDSESFCPECSTPAAKRKREDTPKLHAIIDCIPTTGGVTVQQLLVTSWLGEATLRAAIQKLYVAGAICKYRRDSRTLYRRIDAHG